VQSIRDLSLIDEKKSSPKKKKTKPQSTQNEFCNETTRTQGKRGQGCWLLVEQVSSARRMVLGRGRAGRTHRSTCGDEERGTPERLPRFSTMEESSRRVSF
jgi:hypothetical protein